MDIIAQGLEDKEYLTLLGWIIQTYPGATLFGHPRLDIPADKLPNLCSPEVRDVC